MPKPSVTEATNINAEVVLQLGKYHSAQELRKLQAKLTGTAREIRGLTSGNTLLSRIGEKLSDEQIQLLRDAAKLIESVGTNIEHAKEKRHRGEVATKALQKERDSAAKKLITSAYPLPSETLEQKLDIIRLALVLNRAGCFQSFYTSLELSLRFRNYVSDTSKLIGWESPKDFWESKIRSFRNDLHDEVQQYVGVRDGKSVQERFHDIQLKIEKLQPEVLHDPYEIETLRLWSVALSPAEQQEGDQ
ncbi:hypothetical protein [Pseudomonas sp. H3(2019)]|uniref:hypothetical protein n=1 Tax=Pseudomonas sp. H3(2019) TaxID=2598724 RepID=UPI001193AC61|nr:hypothetical protein [Pseudomonas sp. H3(2019)]TVT83993.1 hypothetical protein FPT12_10300 [Pseudomonas sp. H3(2019)]